MMVNETFTVGPPAAPVPEKPMSPQQRGALRRKNVPIAERKRIVKAYLESADTLTQREFAKVHDIPLSSFGNWVRTYRPKLEKQLEAQGQLPMPNHKGTTNTMTTTTAKVHNDELRAAHQRIQELEGQLKDAKTKIKALQNVVVLLGHQVGDEE